MFRRFVALFARAQPSPSRPTADVIREHLEELSVAEAVALARGIALRDGDRELAAALQAVLLLHLTGGSLAPVAALVMPEQLREGWVN